MKNSQMHIEVFQFDQPIYLNRTLNVGTSGNLGGKFEEIMENGEMTHNYWV